MPIQFRIYTSSFWQALATSTPLPDGQTPNKVECEQVLVLASTVVGFGPLAFPDTPTRLIVNLWKQGLPKQSIAEVLASWGS